MKKNAWIGIGVVAVLGAVIGVWVLSSSMSGPRPNAPVAETVEQTAANESADAAELVDGEDEDAAGQADVLEHQIRKIAQVGDYEFVFNRNITDLGGAHPEVVNQYTTKNVATGKPVKATELFTESNVMSAFSGAIYDDVYGADQATAGTFQKLKTAKTHSEFTRHLASLGAEVSIHYRDACDGETFTFDPATDNFAIVGFNEQTGKASVHFAITGTSHICDAGFPRLRLEIDAPAALRAALAEAASGSKGFFPKPKDLEACDQCPVDFTKVELAGG